MALKLYKDVGLTQEIAEGSPLTTEHPISGSSVEVKVYLRNNNSAKYYTNISIDPQDTTSTDESNWIQLAPDNAGSAGTYLATSVALSMVNIGASGSGDTTGKPFWVKVTTPSVGDSMNKTDIFFNVTAKEYAV